MDTEHRTIRRGPCTCGPHPKKFYTLELGEDIHLADLDIGMQGWHTIDGKAVHLVWTHPHHARVESVYDSWDLVPPELESEMARYFRTHPDASTD